MHYYSLKSRYLRVVLLSLVFLLTAGQLNAKVVYFKNTANWSTVKVHMWGGDRNTQWPGNDAIKVNNDDNTWWYIDAGTSTTMIFHNNSGTQTGDVPIPSDNNAFVWNGDGSWKGYWETYNPTPVEQTYYLKHPWPGEGWSWKQLTANGDGTYSVIAKYGNDGCNWNTTADDGGSRWIDKGSITFVGSPASGDNCKFTLNPTAGTITITKLGAEAISEIYVFGSLDFGETWDDTYGQGAKMTDAGNGIFTYDFTIGFSGQTYYAFHAKTNYDNYKFLRNDNNTEVAMGGTAAYAQHSARNDKSFFTNGFLKNGRYRITVNTNDNTIGIVLLEEPIYTPVYSTVFIFGDIADKQWNENNCSILLNDNKGVFSYAFRYEQGMGNGWAFRVKKADDSSWKTVCNNSADLTLENELDINEHDTRGDVAYYSNHMQPGHVYTVFLNTNTGKVYLREGGKYGIPVYPRGVQSEAELDAYDFTANPVVYLVSNMLNNNRISPEWQMISDGNGRYHLNGFAARTGKGTNNYRARIYTAKDEFIETEAVELDFDDNNANLSEGKLYNANVAVSDGNYTLTLTEDASAQGRMPFIALVGYAMQQDQEYKTPRAFEGHPADVSTSKGWQEAWLQYDENGNLVKDREGNVMYTTMWPPKNPVYFTANVGGERLYSSENMTFKPVTGEDGNYMGKTGAAWTSELKGSENGEAYKGLNLDANTIYYRYVVPDIWYVGSAKIWTGWNSEAVNSDGWKAMWSYHRNWGYSNRKSSDTDGTDINAETTYGVSTAEGSNGNFKFDNPTYFKTIEFFYSTEHPNTGSKIYTTLAFGNAQIEAQSHKQGDAYDRGQYKPSVTIPAGNEVKSYIIRCYDAATNQLVTLNNGIVAQGEGDPSKADFQLDREGLAEGKYYYEMEVVFNNSGVERTSVVKSNPFTIYFPGVYTTETQSYQLLKLATAMNGYNYLTVAQDTEKGAIYAANLDADGQVTAVAAITSEQRAAAVAQYENRANLYTDRVLVLAPVPAQFKLDAEKSTTATMAIVNYSLDETTNAFVEPQDDGSMAYAFKQGHMGNVNHKAVMNYTTTVDGSTTPKSTMGKEVSTYMVRPNAVAGALTVNVERVENTTEPIGDLNYASDYFKVSAHQAFMDPNTEDNHVYYHFDGNGADRNSYTISGERRERGVKLNNIDVRPNDQCDEPAEYGTLTVVTTYPGPGNQILEANKFEPVVIDFDELRMQYGEREIPQALFTISPRYNEQFHRFIAGYYYLELDEQVPETIGDYELEIPYYAPTTLINERYDARSGNFYYINDDDEVVYKNVFSADELYVNGDFETGENILLLDCGPLPNYVGLQSVKLNIKPVYPVLVDYYINATGMSADPMAPALKNDNLDKICTIYGKSAVKNSTVHDNSIITGIDDIANKTVESVRFVNVAGLESDKPFEGMNIVVTKYTDGSTQAVKMVK